ncbi:MAG: protein-(glutamine-N5) methyltransferase, release factor-specific, partial [Clostridia bacterium]|nr:protein-(glutamine-N5) methyltransferase, release factor-specific [Clostridia bacterium]
ALCGDVFKSAAADKKYDLIVSNPPYIKQKDMAALQKEVTFEPDTALCGGEDGLDFYRTIAKNYANSLLPDGKLMFEVGFDEAKAVSEILSANGYFDIGVKSDLGGNERVVFGTAKGL